MRLLFLGTGEFGVPALRRLAQSGHSVQRCISQPDRPAGRGLQVQPTPIRAAADALKLEHLAVDDVNALSPELFAGVDLAVVVAFGQKIGERLLVIPPRGFVNLHASLLPRYRGAAPFQWAILEGDRTTGVTLFQLDPRWDAGPILASSETPIGDTETAAELHDRLALLAADLLMESLERMTSGTLVPRPQDPALASRAPKLRKEDGAIDLAQPAAHVVRRILGLWSWPAAACVYDDGGGTAQRVQLARAKLLDDSTLPDDVYPPGAFRPDGTIQASPGRWSLLEVKPAGRALMSIDAFGHARRTTPPARLLRISK